MPAFSLRSQLRIHQMALLRTVVIIKLQLTTHLSTRKDERLTYSGRFTLISGHPSAVGRPQDSESSPVVKDKAVACVYRADRHDKRPHISESCL